MTDRTWDAYPRKPVRYYRTNHPFCDARHSGSPQSKLVYRQFESVSALAQSQRRPHMRTLFGIGLAIFAVALVITTWSVEPTVGKTPSVSVDPLGLMTTTTNLPQAHYQDFSTIY